MNLQIKDSILCIVDVQEKLVKAIENKKYIDRIAILSKAAGILNIDAIKTEQYPKGLGRTIPIVEENLPADIIKIEKYSFSCFGAVNFRSALKKQKRKNLILCGIESHVCILQTAVGAVKAGYNVFIPRDAVASRKKEEYLSAIDFLTNIGVKFLTVESLLFILLRNSKHKNFKEITALIK